MRLNVPTASGVVFANSLKSGMLMILAVMMMSKTHDPTAARNGRRTMYHRQPLRMYNLALGMSTLRRTALEDIPPYEIALTHEARDASHGNVGVQLPGGEWQSRHVAPKSHSVMIQSVGDQDQMDQVKRPN